MSFDIQPKSIKPGEKATLTWAVENPQSTTIDPIGRVAPRGVMTITPSATTTYTLSVTGASDSSDKRTITITVQGTTAVASTAAANMPKPVPRTPDGHPDLSGVYGYGQGPGGRGGPPPAQPVLKPGAEKFKVVRAADDTGQYSTCMPPGIPQSFFVPYYTQVVQAPKHVIIAHEYLNLHRIIPTDGRPHPPDPDPSWMGNAVAKWEGDTLVIDSIGYNDRTEINGYKHTESLHIVERLSRPDYNTLSYEATVEDPNVFAQPWVIRRTFPLLPEFDALNEYVCENNRNYKPLFGNK